MELWKIQNVHGLATELCQKGNVVWEIMYRYYGNETGRKLHETALSELLSRNGNLTPQETIRFNELYKKQMDFQREYNTALSSFNRVKQMLYTALGDI